MHGRRKRCARSRAARAFIPRPCSESLRATSTGYGSRHPSRMLRREVVGDRALRGNGGDRVLEHQVIGAVDLDDDREAIEVLDARVELAAINEMNADRQSFAASVVEKYVLDVRLRRRGTGFRSDLHHLVNRPKK